MAPSAYRRGGTPGVCPFAFRFLQGFLGSFWRSYFRPKVEPSWYNSSWMKDQAEMKITNSLDFCRLWSAFSATWCLVLPSASHPTQLREPLRCAWSRLRYALMVKNRIKTWKQNYCIDRFSLHFSHAETLASPIHQIKYIVEINFTWFGRFSLFFSECSR